MTSLLISSTYQPTNQILPFFPSYRHVPYTHHNTISKRKNATPVPLCLASELTIEGFEGTWERILKTSEMTKDTSKVR